MSDDDIKQEGDWHSGFADGIGRIQSPDDTTRILHLPLTCRIDDLRQQWDAALADATSADELDSLAIAIHSMLCELRNAQRLIDDGVVG
jgi:hypothetical protein